MLFLTLGVAGMLKRLASSSYAVASRRKKVATNITIRQHSSSLSALVLSEIPPEITRPSSRKSCTTPAHHHHHRTHTPVRATDTKNASQSHAARPFTRQNRIGPQTPTYLTQTQTHGDAPKLHSSPPASSPPPTSASPLLCLSPTTLHLTLEPAHPKTRSPTDPNACNHSHAIPQSQVGSSAQSIPIPAGLGLHQNKSFGAEKNAAGNGTRKKERALHTQETCGRGAVSAVSHSSSISISLSLTHHHHHPSSNHAASLDQKTPRLTFLRRTRLLHLTRASRDTPRPGSSFPS
ncbi:hypothetical protein CCHR01_07572 [Colletotrichum chrysophilum]|uniref:Uncharacterized protein n=1 Tax=Colletotrichum chrysophilum TaxID=1836956 RepID=A0AAD9EFV0_9PEZI|nr:hypothetical protein CCHR01_07572 [Colletotrichum chrysophilum]